MRKDARAPVRFDHPPVVEVACGLTFTLQQPLLSAHVGAFWESVRSDFPDIQEVAPLPSIIEPAAMSSPEPQQVGLKLVELPPLRRVWFISEDGGRLIQLQEDRLIYNWKLVGDDGVYPGFETVIAEFDKQVGRFSEFLESMNLGSPTYTQCELTYINLIGPHNGLDVLPASQILIDHRYRSDSDRFLPAPESFNWNSTYSLPDGIGRLHVTAQTARRIATRENVLRLDVVARGLPKDNSESGRVKWFRIAHDWITQGFTDATAPELHERSWGRTA